MGIIADFSGIKLSRFSGLEIRSNTPKGRGVFATQDIPAKTVLDVCPVLVLGLEENLKHITKTSLYHYTYNWPGFNADGEKKVAQAVIFGLGSMFNHAHDQNVVWERDFERLIITYRTSRDIVAGEELCISYGDHLTFKDADTPIPPPPETELEQLLQIHVD